MKIINTIAALVVSAGSLVNAAQTGDITKDSFIKSAGERIEKAGLPGVAVAVVRPNGNYWAHGFGYADIASQKPMTEDTIIAIASISKTIAGAAAMQLVEKGDVNLNRNISNHLPFAVENPKQPGKTITLRHALTHTTGILDYDPVYNSDIVYHYGGDNPLELSSFVEDYLTPAGQYYSATNNFADTVPGSTAAYSNIVFGLVGTLIEHVSKQPFNEYTRDNIFKPLGMDASGWKYHEVNAANVGTQYVRTDSGYTPEQLQGKTYDGWRAVKPHGLATYPDGGLRTSVSDLSRFLATVMNGGAYKGARILSEKTIKNMLTPQTFETADGKTYAHPDRGLVFGMRLIGDLRVTGHTGSDPGVNTYMFFDPETKAGAIFFTNSSMYKEEQSDLAYSILKELLQNADAFVAK